MNRGTLNGYRKGGWKVFRPQVRTVAQAGGETQPTVNTSRFGYEPVARYLELDNGLTIAQYQISYTSFNAGSGDAYLIRLPKKAERWADYPIAIGTGMAYEALADPSENMPITPQLCATGTWTEVTGDEDNWFQMAYPHAVTWGTSLIFSGAGVKTVTVTHNLGFTPAISDISVTPTTLPNANTHNAPRIENVTSTTFDVSLRALIGTGNDWTFGWKIIARPNGSFINSLVGPLKPWAWASPFLLLAQVYYQAA